jgi:DNA-binding NarL/FixJ family response regulator
MSNTSNDFSRPRILLADDHKMVAEGLKGLLASEFDLADTVEDGIALVEAAIRYRPDMIVADIAMPGLSGLEALAILKRRDPAVKMVFLTMHRDVAYVLRARELGASGFVLKAAAPEELICAIYAVLEGKTFFSPAVTGTIANDTEEDAAVPRPGDSLTPRQQQILGLLSEGRSAKEIGRMLNISPRTVEFHKYRIMEVHGLHSSAELIHFAIRQGLTAS